MVRAVFVNEDKGFYLESDSTKAIQLRYDDIVVDDEIIAVFDGDYWHYMGMEFTDVWISEGPK